MFPIYTEATDRLIGPRFGLPATTLGWFAGDVLLLVLAIWDRRPERRFGPFAVAFTAMIAYHALVFVAARFRIPGWAAFTDWFAHI